VAKEYLQMAFFNFKERLQHYTDVASGKKATKSGSKFTAGEQRAYARGMRDEMNRERRAFAYKNATELERQAYKQQRRERLQAYKASKVNTSPKAKKSKK